MIGIPALVPVPSVVAPVRVVLVAVVPMVTIIVSRTPRRALHHHVTPTGIMSVIVIVAVPILRPADVG